MLQYTLYFIGFLIHTVFSDVTCRSDPKNLIMCLRPLLDTWEHLRNEESHASNLLIPVPFYTKPSIFALCNSFVETKEKCFEGDCPDNMMLSFVKGQLGFVCGPNLPLYIENYECLTGSLLKSRQCLQPVYGMPNPLNSTGQCAGLPKFFSCAAGSLEKSCGRTAVALLNGVIEQLGCQNDEGQQYKADMNKTNESGQLTDETLKDYLKRESPKNLKELMTSKENSTEFLVPPKDHTKLHAMNFMEVKINDSAKSKDEHALEEAKLHFKEKTVDEKKVVDPSTKTEKSAELVDTTSPTNTPVVVTVPTTIALEPETNIDKLNLTIIIPPQDERLNKTSEMEETTKTLLPETEPPKLEQQTTADTETTKAVFKESTHSDPGIPQTPSKETETNTTENVIVHPKEVHTTTITLNLTEDGKLEKPVDVKIETATINTEMTLTVARDAEKPKLELPTPASDVRKEIPRTQEPLQPKTQDVRKPEEIVAVRPVQESPVTGSILTTKSPIIDFEKPMEDPKIEPLDEVLKHFNLSSLTKKADAEKDIDKKEASPDTLAVNNATTVPENEESILNDAPPAVFNSTADAKDPTDEFKSGYENRTKPIFSKPATLKREEVVVSEKEKLKNDDSSKEIKQRQTAEVIDEPIIEKKLLPAIPEENRTEKSTTLANTSKPATTTTEPDTTTLETTTPTTRKPTTIRKITTPQPTSAEIIKKEQETATTPFVRLSQRKSAIEESVIPKDPEDPKCTDEDVEYISACHEKLMRRVSAFSALASSKIRFPLFNLTSTEVVAVCKVYDQGVRCSEAQNDRCRDSHILTFLNTQLESLCFRIYSMKYDYDCMRKTYLENMDCVEKITGSAESADKCTGQQESYDCFVKNSGCGEGSLILIKEILRGYGCRVDTKPWLTKAPTTTTRRMRKARTTTPMPSPTKEENEETSDRLKNVGKKVETTTLANEFTSGTTIDDLVEANKDLLETDAPSGPSIELVERKSVRNRSVKDEPKPLIVEQPKANEEVTEPQMTFHNQCGGEERNKARVCVAPLLKSLILLRKWRPELTEMRFPIYKYTREELLDLCDGYANAFLCAGHGPIRHCLKDELISFAQDHLGYQCSPQNIGRFMQHYDCIVNVEMPGPCAQFVKGEAVPGNTKVEKCNGIGAYRMCMLPLIKKSCAAGATSEFEQTIMQFGC